MARKRIHRAPLAAGAALAAAAGALTITGTAAAAPACPAALGDLTPDSIARATDTALAAVGQAFPDRDVSGAYVSGATRSETGPVGQQLIDQCGPDVQRKSVIVDFVFPAMLPDAAHSYGAAVVSMINGQYSVWRTA